MIQNPLFRQCLATVPAEERAAFDRNFDIAERLYNTITVQNITPDQLAKRLNVTKQQLTRWLTGRHPFNDETIKKLNAVLFP